MANAKVSTPTPEPKDNPVVAEKVPANERVKSTVTLPNGTVIENY